MRSIAFALVVSEASGIFLQKILQSPECQCVSMDGATGTPFPVGTKQNGTSITYSEDTGASCEAWDDQHDPICQESGAPDWCKDKWCFVDPCSCGIVPEPKRSSYFPDARKNGRPVYYSYTTCGSKDSWTGKNHDIACPNQKDETACGAIAACAWTGKKCLGKDLVGDCEIGRASCRERV